MNGNRFWQSALNRKRGICAVVVLLAGMMLEQCAIAGADGQLPASAKILDPDILFYGSPYPVISPDGKWVAYISKGFVCVCNVDDPKPRRLSEVPKTWTHVLAQPEFVYAEGDINAVYRNMDRDQSQKWVASINHSVVGLQWVQEG